MFLPRSCWRCSYFLIEQCLSNKNEIATVSFSKKKLELNKALNTQ